MNKNTGIDSLLRIARRSIGREMVEQGAKSIAQRAASRAVSRGAAILAKGAANPVFIVGDVFEFGVRASTGRRNAGRATSAAVYIGAGAVVGGPVGAAIASGVWIVGQLIDLIIE